MREHISRGSKLRLFAEFCELITEYLCSVTKYQNTLRIGVSCIGLPFKITRKKDIPNYLS
jgi:hypothetical protein